MPGRRLRHLPRVLAVLLASAAPGCAPPSASTPLLNVEQSTLLTAEEIRSAQFANAIDVLRHLRPGFLVSRGPTSILAAPRDDLLVIVNGQVMGGVDELGVVPATGILWVRRLSAADVHSRFGRSAPSGGIEVRLAP